MPIKTPTRSSPGDLPGLPDEATLEALANSFFQALPGQSSLPLSDAQVSSLSLPHDPASAHQVVDTLPQAQFPPPDLTYAVPTAYTPSLATSPIPGHAPASPYYFLDEASTSRSRGASPAQDRITAHPLHMPGTGELQALVAQITVGYPRLDPVKGNDQAERHFYFLQSAGTSAEHSHAFHAPESGFDVHAVRRDFPILAERVNGKPLVWLDNAATTQKPQAVIDRLSYFYEHENSNIHRAAHELAARATDAYEVARQKVARFLGAASPEEIIFVRGTTEAINLVAHSFGAQYIQAGDEIILSHLEHHANIVPWQMIAAEKGAKIRVIPVDDHGQVLLDEYRKLLNPRTRIVAVTQVSNALGTITPVEAIVTMAHQAGAYALIDGAQAVSHLPVNLQTLGADFYVFSGHKVFGPTGIGVVYGKKALLETLPPYQGGGNMIVDVTFERTQYQHPPARFEAGTGNIADAVGLGAALDYLEHLGRPNVAHYEHQLLDYATQAIVTVPGLRLIGTAPEKTSVLSFVLQGYSPVDVGRALNEDGIAVRAGHHCAQPILRRFGVEATVRPSLAFYNTCEEIDHLVHVLHQLARKR